MGNKFDWDEFHHQRAMSDIRKEYFNEPDYERRLVDIEFLEKVKWEMSREDFYAISNLNRRDPVPVRLVDILVRLQIPVKV